MKLGRWEVTRNDAIEMPLDWVTLSGGTWFFWWGPFEIRRQPR